MAAVSAEKQDLLDTVDRKPSVVVTHLTYNQIPKAVRSFKQAFLGNPQLHYLNDTPDKPEGRWPDIVENIAMYMGTTLFIFRGKNIVNAVDKGSSCIYTTLAPNSPKGKQKLSERVLEYVFKRITGILSTNSLSLQQAERRKEFHSKLDLLLKTALGARQQEMLYVDLLFTAPEAQGRGYASALVRSILAIADSEQRGTWLISGDPANISFYNYHGFETVGEIALGDTNPDWHEAPVVITLLVVLPVFILF
ncbi:hypothetical protein HWV62_24237 [Athelia sp. TMB]|nr:hypothetical protein HWV62_24237 [Athelia sp. TMB]